MPATENPGPPPLARAASDTFSLRGRRPTPYSCELSRAALASRGRRPRFVPRRGTMIPAIPTPLVHLGNLFPRRQVWAKCEHLALAGSFKIRGAAHLLGRLAREGGTRQLVVPSMGNTALGVAVGAKAF